MGKALGDQHLPERTPIAFDDAQLAAILVFVAIRRAQIEPSATQQLGKPPRRLATKNGLGLALRRTDFGRVDIGNADLDAIEPERVAIDDASDAFTACAETEILRRGARDDRRRLIEKKGIEPRLPDGNRAQNCEDAEDERHQQPATEPNAAAAPFCPAA